MSLIPDYIKTEWRGCSHVILKFSDSNCIYCKNEWKDITPKGNHDNLSIENSKESESTKTKFAECLHTSNVECFVSTFNVWEYEEDKMDVNDVLGRNKANTLKEEEEIENAIEPESLPPTITSETWELWEQFWDTWKESYLNLSWMHRYGTLCKQEDIDWYNDYCNDYPQVLQYITFCENIELEKEKDIDLSSIECLDSDDPDRMELLDELYEELSYKRYWIHFRLFLRDWNLEVSKELRDFFISHGIREDPPQLTISKDEDISASESAEKGDQLDVKFDNKVCEHQLQNSEEDYRQNLEVVQETTDNEKSSSTKENGDSNNELLSVEDKSTLKENGDTTHACNNTIKTEEPCLKEISLMNGEEEEEGGQHGVDESMKENNGNDSYSPLKKDVGHDMRKKDVKNRKQPRAIGMGIAHALRHVQQLAKEGKIDDANASDAFVFGACETTDVEIIRECVEKGSNTTSIRGESSRLKRKHEQVENDSSHLCSDEHKEIGTTQTNVGSRVISNIFMWFRYLIDGVSHGLFKFILNFTMPKNSWFKKFLFPVNWWKQHFFFEQSLLEQKMKSAQKSSVHYLRKALSPTLRRLPNSGVLHGPSLYLTRVYTKDEGKCNNENLIRLTQVEEPASEKGLYVEYMTSEDIDYALEDQVELAHVSHDEESTHRTVTTFDEEGISQNVFKVPANDGKMRCVLEEDYKPDSVDKDKIQMCDTPIEKDNEAWLCPTAITSDAVPPKFFFIDNILHKKINRILNYSRLIRFSKESSYYVPEDMPKELSKYWCQRYRLFLRYDEGIKLDTESWFSVTPEMIAAHQAERLTCHTVIDAFCGAGGNAIQLAATCSLVIAIDIDAAKIELARHNAKIYGVEDRIQFIEGDFFSLAPQLKADSILLSPPWGGVHYLNKEMYDVFFLGGQMDGRKLFEAANQITPNIAIYLPKTSNTFQLIELAGCDGKVDFEYSHISNKRKSMTAYFGDLVNYRQDISSIH